MKDLMKKLMTLLAALALVALPASVLTGCEDDDDPIEESADEIEDAADELEEETD
ncbi:MAG: Vmc-like lipoprotein signal peptide domain-containing protein [Phycisphaerae bacterium]